MSKLFSFSILFLISFSISAQTIQEQFEEFREEASTWEEYKVIKIYRLRDFWNVVSDTLTRNQTDIMTANREIKSLNKEIDSLQSSLSMIKEELKESESLNSSIGFLGIDINKIFYNIVVWTIIGVLCFSIGTIYLMFKARNRTTRQTRKDHEELVTEFKEYKEKSTQKQIALKRELQTAINTLEENRIKVSNKLGYNKGSSSIG